VLAVRSGDPERDLSGATRIVVQAADEIVDGGRVTPSTLSALREHFGAPAVVQEFLYLVAGYQMFASVSATVDDDPTIAHPWPPDGNAPVAH
jgi:hypothetical protein